jgi:N-acetylneuraminate synthase
MKYDKVINIGDREISISNPTYFIADIAANHDGSLERAKELIWKSKEAGADCAKFQHFISGKIVSDVGFSDGVGQVSHQADWKKSVSDIYDQYHTRREWTEALVETCVQAEIEFMTTPYDFDAVDMFRDIVPAYKIGSGDITFHDLIERVAKVGSPVLLATGAATMEEVEEATELVLRHNRSLCLMQCNTNYTGSLENFAFVNLRVLQAFSRRWPDMVLGISDHTPGHSVVLGAVTLGARVVEKHFTDDTTREGPDHSFALDPDTWRAMVDATRELEFALGDGIKRIEDNEKETVVIQRRALRANDDLVAGTVLEPEHLVGLRPCPKNAVPPKDLARVIGRVLKANLKKGEELTWTLLD